MKNNRSTGKIAWTLGVILIVGGILAWFFYGVFAPKPGIRVAIQSRDHVLPETAHDPYTSNPSVSGPHYPSWSKCGIFEEPQPVELLIHNMEHGHVIIFYKKEGSQAFLDDLKKFVTEELKEEVILTPNDSIPSLIAAASWGWYELYDQFEPEKLKAFYKAHKFHAPERISCEDKSMP